MSSGPSGEPIDPGTHCTRTWKNFCENFDPEGRRAQRWSVEERRAWMLRVLEISRKCGFEPKFTLDDVPGEVDTSWFEPEGLWELAHMEYEPREGYEWVLQIPVDEDVLLDAAVGSLRRVIGMFREEWDDFPWSTVVNGAAWLLRAYCDQHSDDPNDALVKRMRKLAAQGGES